MIQNAVDIGAVHLMARKGVASLPIVRAIGELEKLLASCSA